MFSSSTQDTTTKAQEKLKKFVKKTPNATFTFDNERGAQESQICRENGPGQPRECLIVKLESKKLFECMQDLGFFCALPMEPSKTYIECKPLP